MLNVESSVGQVIDTMAYALSDGDCLDYYLIFI